MSKAKQALIAIVLCLIGIGYIGSRPYNPAEASENLKPIKAEIWGWKPVALTPVPVVSEESILPPLDVVGFKLGRVEVVRAIITQPNASWASGKWNPDDEVFIVLIPNERSPIYLAINRRPKPNKSQ